MKKIILLLLALFTFYSQARSELIRKNGFVYYSDSSFVKNDSLIYILKYSAPDTGMIAGITDALLVKMFSNKNQEIYAGLSEGSYFTQCNFQRINWYGIFDGQDLFLESKKEVDIEDTIFLYLVFIIFCAWIGFLIAFYVGFSDVFSKRSLCLIMVATVINVAVFFIILYNWANLLVASSCLPSSIIFYFLLKRRIFYWKIDDRLIGDWKTAEGYFSNVKSQDVEKILKFIMKKDRDNKNDISDSVALMLLLKLSEYYLALGLFSENKEQGQELREVIKDFSSERLSDCEMRKKLHGFRWDGKKPAWLLQQYKKYIGC